MTIKAIFILALTLGTLMCAAILVTTQESNISTAIAAAILGCTAGFFGHLFLIEINKKA